MSVRCEGCGLEYAGARGAGGPLRPARQRCCAGRYLRMLAEVPRFHRAARATARLRAARRTQTLGEFLARAAASPRYFVAHFVIPLVSAVWSCAPQTALRYPAALPVPVPRQPRHCWRSPVRRSGAPSSAARREYVERIGKRLTAVRTATPVRAVHGARRRGRGHRDDGDGGRVRRRGDRRPPRPGAARCWPTPPPPSGGCSARSATRATRPCCTPTPRCCRRPPAPAPPGTTCALLRALRRTGAGQLRHEPAAAARRARRTYVVTLNADGAIAAETGTGPHGLRAPDLHPGVGGRPAAAARRCARRSPPSPAPTTAGASTRTAAAPASRRPRPWGCAGDHRPRRP